MKVAFTVPLDSDTALSAGDIAEIIKAVREDNIKYLFTEQQYNDSIAKQIEAETEAKVYIIDSAVTGDGSKDSYLKAMKNNLTVLKEALK
jgi:zinc transport system substrate-binding protein